MSLFAYTKLGGKIFVVVDEVNKKLDEFFKERGMIAPQLVKSESGLVEINAAAIQLGGKLAVPEKCDVYLALRDFEPMMQRGESAAANSKLILEHNTAETQEEANKAVLTLSSLLQKKDEAFALAQSTITDLKSENAKLKRMLEQVGASKETIEEVMSVNGYMRVNTVTSLLVQRGFDLEKEHINKLLLILGLVKKYSAYDKGQPTGEAIKEKLIRMSYARTNDEFKDEYEAAKNDTEGVAAGNKYAPTVRWFHGRIVERLYQHIKSSYIGGSTTKKQIDDKYEHLTKHFKRWQDYPLVGSESSVGYYDFETYLNRLATIFDRDSDDLKVLLSHAGILSKRSLEPLKKHRKNNWFILEDDAWKISRNANRCINYRIEHYIHHNTNE
ncbi:hypothetical protein KMW28_27005 [Flammeovirga yaeyamensis]|uniref:Uncharacterized protein n=1 Tax=Flammeovirga yaeyamensis TaxID=367791 RepID=A0AAX1NAP8_9BACT|nr:hypothetical protein [Flammeovirga yaeyamensis]MBB3700074.1 hypothetical protein [Flammeovirga yaeyamensis]NMF37492.1 hypothetical protein [Flammeovirga yaeyamensis]QWG04549.1 hypothetical protein KMW28_27005 [Flammeovirga yaeyamensis]